jgi:hypothetical protein
VDLVTEYRAHDAEPVTRSEAAAPRRVVNTPARAALVDGPREMVNARSKTAWWAILGSNQ